MEKFRLATVLKLREQSRDERRRALAQAYEAERILREQSRVLQLEIEEVRQQMRTASGVGSVNVENLLSTRRYEMVMRSQVQQVEIQLKQVLTEVERRRNLLVEADREVKTLEKLRERQALQAASSLAAREAKQLDEAALRGYRQREGSP